MNEILERCKEHIDAVGGDCELFCQGDKCVLHIKLKNCVLPSRMVAAMSDEETLSLLCDVVTVSADKYANLLLLASEMNATFPYCIARVTQSNDGNYTLTLVRFDLDVNEANCTEHCDYGVCSMEFEINKIAHRINELFM